MNYVRIPAYAVALALVGLSACSNLPSEVREETQKLRSTVEQTLVPEAHINQVQTPLVRSTRVPYVADNVALVDLTVDRGSLRAIVSSLARDHRWTVAYSTAVNADATVTAEIRGMDPRAALREIAFRAGYVALFEAENRVVITDRGTMSFRVPFGQIDGVNANYSMCNSFAGSCGGQGGGASGGAPSQGGSGGTTGSTTSVTSRASASVSGTVTASPDSLKNAVLAVAGGDASVSVFPAAGLITIRGDSQQLRRAQVYLDQYARAARTMIEVKTAIVEVSLTDEFRFGIDWSRVVPLDRAISSGLASIRLANANVSNAPLTTQVTTSSINAVIQALGQKTRMRVVSRPELLLSNGVWSIWRDASSVPYLGEVKSNISGASGTVTTTATISFAQDGISLSALASVLDSNTIGLTLMPVISSISGFKEFKVGDTIATAPTTPVKEGIFPLVVEDGKTIIVAGSRVEVSSASGRGIPGTQDIPALNLLFNERNDNNSAKELFMLVQSRLIPPTSGAIVVMESM